MELLVKKTYGGVSPTLLRGEIAALAREAARFMGVYWHTHFRPLHFDDVAWVRYNYAPRTAKYTLRKFRKHGHTRPLVWSGDSERRTQIQDVRATYRGGMAIARVVMHAPTLNFRKHPESPDMRAELTTVIPEEMQEISAAVGEFIRQRIDVLRGGAVVVMKGETLV